MSGPNGHFEMRIPTGKADGPETFQTARQRGKAEDGRFFYRLIPEGSTTGLTVQSDATISWRSTFEPFRRELPRAYPWLEFVGVDLATDDKRIVDGMVRQDVRDGILSGLIPDQFSRKLVIDNADFGLVMSSRIGAAISMDAMHARVLQARMVRGEAAPVYGQEALTILFPSVDGMTWEDVHVARKVPGLPELRALLAEIEETAWTEAEAGRQLDAAVHEQYQARFHAAAAKLAPSLRGTVVGTAVGIGLGLVTGGLALPVGIAAGMVTDIATAYGGHRAYARSWLAAGEYLTRRAKE